MPDISMCSNKYCSRKKECYRFMCIPDKYRQSYMSFSCCDTNKWENFMPINGREIIYENSDERRI